MFSLPAEARNHFDQEADFFITALKPLPSRGSSSELRGSRAHVPVRHHFTDADVRGDLEVSYKDWLGRLCGFEVHGNDIHEIIPETEAARLERLADSVARSRDLWPCCSKGYVSRHLIDWVRRRCLGQAADVSWTADFLGALARDVCAQTILIPIEGLDVTATFQLGRVMFAYFTESSIEDMIRFIPEDCLTLPEYRDRIRRRYQGRVFARYQCVAEETQGGCQVLS